MAESNFQLFSLFTANFHPCYLYGSWESEWWLLGTEFQENLILWDLTYEHICEWIQAIVDTPIFPYQCSKQFTNKIIFTHIGYWRGLILFFFTCSIWFLFVSTATERGSSTILDGAVMPVSFRAQGWWGKSVSSLLGASWTYTEISQWDEELVWPRAD